MYKNGEKVSRISSVGTGLSFALQKRKYRVISFFLSWFIRCRISDSPDKKSCEVYFSFFMELQVTVFSQSWMKIWNLREFKFIYRISECRIATSYLYSKPYHFGLVDFKNGKTVLFRKVGKLNCQSVDAIQQTRNPESLENRWENLMSKKSCPFGRPAITLDAVHCQTLIASWNKQHETKG